MGPLRVPNLLFFILGASLTLALLSGCGNSGNSNPTSSTSSSGNPSGSASCGAAGNPSTNSAAPSSVDVVTYHYDNLRTGQNTQETILTPANVNSTKFGKLGEFAVIGKVDAQPLYLSNLSIPGGTKNVLYVATEHGCVYAFDADSIGSSGSKPLWITSTQLPGEMPSDERGCGQVTPEIGVTSTPVIDRKRGAIYVVAVSKNASGTYIHRIHALDLTTGAELFGGPTVVTASYPGTGAGSSGGNVVFDPSAYNERPGLLEFNGTIYTTWGSHCDQGAYTSWVMAYSADTLKQTAVLNLVPNGSDGGIWMSGAAPALDASGNIYFILGNGTFDTNLNASGFPPQHDCGNCFAKISSSAPLSLLDYFTPSNTVAQSDQDLDFGSGGPLLLPDLTDASGTTRHLAVGSGKDGNIYVLDRDNMGKFNSGADNIYQLITGELSGGEFGKPSYFNDTVYYGAVGDTLKAFPITNATLAPALASQSPTNFAYPGTTPSISANGNTNGIVWAVENGNTGVLHAYDATNVGKEFYNSNQASNARDHFADNKFITPMVANGRVYVGTPTSVAVFGLLP
jgi:hypothetical protein